MQKQQEKNTHNTKHNTANTNTNKHILHTLTNKRKPTHTTRKRNKPMAKKLRPKLHKTKHILRQRSSIQLVPEKIHIHNNTTSTQRKQ